jgi:crotonobetainyl-CoA:carnitine CoA-transferase CaiB-like acyl-CoA transferase
MTALTGLRIIELTARVAGDYAGKLLSDFGAEVIKIEPPAGAPTRAIGPFADGKSIVFSYLNTNKKSVMLDGGQEADQAVLHRLLASADAVIDDHSVTLPFHKMHPHLIYCAITPFGQAAPKEWQQASSPGIMNASGWAYHTPSESPHDQPPLGGAGRFLADFEGGLQAALCISASLLRKRTTGLGQFIDISQVETLLNRADCVLGRMLAGEQEPGPERTRYDMGGPGASFACADGHVFLLMTSRAHWKGLCTLMGDPEWARAFREDWLEFHCTTGAVAQFREEFRLWIAGQAKVTVSEAAQKLGVALVPINTAADLPGNEQFVHRGYFQELGGVSYPTVPYRMSASPVTLSSAAPELGAHLAEFS